MDEETTAILESMGYGNGTDILLRDSHVIHEAAEERALVTTV